MSTSSMTGYDTSATVYPSPQYGYEGDPRAGGWGAVQYPAHHQQQLPGQGSPSDRYNYYDNR